MNPFRAYFVLAGLLHASTPEESADRGTGDVMEIHDVGMEPADQYSNVSPSSGGVVTGRRRASVRCSKA
jgi:hypothetical protein